MNIRAVDTSDLPKIFVFNEEAVPHVNSIPISDFEQFIRMSSFFLVIEEEGELAGFMIVLSHGEKYDSDNYKYFSSAYSSFDYVDRIVIGESYRGKGFGTQLYEYLCKNTPQERITCEVNIQPPNPKSIQFHQILGFNEVAQQYSDKGKKYVSLMVREI